MPKGGYLQQISDTLKFLQMYNLLKNPSVQQEYSPMAAVYLSQGCSNLV